jgi:cytochrome P450
VLDGEDAEILVGSSWARSVVKGTMTEQPHCDFATAEHFDPFDLVDPFPFYVKARREAPVFYSSELGYWVVTRYDDVKAAFRDLTTFSSEITGKPLREHSPEVKRILDDGGLLVYSGMSMRMPPDHTRIRSFINKAFTPARTAGMEAPIRARVRELLDALRGGRAELVRQLTDDLPALVIFMLLGVPDEDVPKVKKWAQSRTAITWGSQTEEQQVELARDMVKYWQYCLALIDRRFEQKGNDLPSDLVRIYEAGDQSITRVEMASLCYTMLFAGHETTSNMLAEGIKTLLTGGGWSELCADPSLIPNAVDEIIRYCPSLFTWRRLLKVPTTLGGVDLPAGAHLMLVLGSANRDERYFPSGETFDIHRENAKEHLSLGHGVKYCLGGPLARLEARVVLEELTARFPSLRLSTGQRFDYLPNTSLRGPRHVWVEWDAERGSVSFPAAGT